MDEGKFQNILASGSPGCETLLYQTSLAHTLRLVGLGHFICLTLKEDTAYLRADSVFNLNTQNVQSNMLE